MYWFYCLKSASISHVNSQSLVLADYGVKTGYCQLYACRAIFENPQICRGELFACFSSFADYDLRLQRAPLGSGQNNSVFSFNCF
jgi:hypothetical protein